MILTHYFPNLCQNEVTSVQELFTLITEYEPKEQRALATRLLCNSGRALRRFDQFDDYMQRRIQTEQWLYATFLAMGGSPTSQYPFYFILGESKRLKSDFGPGAGKLVLDTAQINPHDISFTLGDSMGLFFSPTTKKLYSLDEIESVSQNTVFVQTQMAPLKPYHRYIEAQLWDKHYLSAAQIIRYYLLFIISYYLQDCTTFYIYNYSSP